MNAPVNSPVDAPLDAPVPAPVLAPVLAPDALGPTVTVGEILVEIVATTAGEGFLAPQPLVGPYRSGAPAIFIDRCGRIGGSAAMVGAVGADDFGRLNLDRLRADGVDVSAVAVDSGFPTGSAFVRERPGRGARLRLQHRHLGRRPLRLDPAGRGAGGAGRATCTSWARRCRCRARSR